MPLDSGSLVSRLLSRLDLPLLDTTVPHASPIYCRKRQECLHQFSSSPMPRLHSVQSTKYGSNTVSSRIPGGCSASTTSHHTYQACHQCANAHVFLFPFSSQETGSIRTVAFAACAMRLHQISPNHMVFSRFRAYWSKFVVRITEAKYPPNSSPCRSLFLEPKTVLRVLPPFNLPQALLHFLIGLISRA